HAHVEKLAGIVAEQARQRGWELMTPAEPERRGPLVMLRCREVETLLSALAERGILCSTRDGALRTSFHYYNSADDVSALIEALDDNGGLMRLGPAPRARAGDSLEARMTGSRLFAALALSALGVVARGGGGGGGGATASKPDKFQIAAEGPFTGDQASIAAGALQAIKLAVKDFNAKGGVHGTQVQLLTWDDQHNAQTASTLQAQGISDPTVLGLIGPMNSGVVLGSAPGLQGASPPLPFISESASNVKVTDSGWSVAHRVNARDDAQGPADAKFMIDQGAKKVYLLDAKSDYSTALADAVQSYLKDKAPTVQTKRDSAQQGQKDFSTIVTNIKAFGPDWVFFADEGPEAGPLVTQLKQAGLTIGQNIQFLGTDGEEDASLIQKSQGAYVGAYATNIVPRPAGS